MTKHALFTARLEADGIIIRLGVIAETVEAKQQLIRIHRYIIATLTS